MIFVGILAVVSLALFARALGFATIPMLDADIARSEVQAAILGFAAGEVALDAAGRGALVAARDGRLALVRPLGDRWVVRLLDHAAAELAAPYLTLRVPEPMFAPVKLDLGQDAARWAAMIGRCTIKTAVTPAQAGVHTRRIVDVYGPQPARG